MKLNNQVLIVEDDETIRKQLKILLCNAGYRVVEISDYKGVLNQMKALSCDLVLLDVNLPETNGEMLLQEYRKNCDTPVIMLTSRVTELDEMLSMSYGADDYITKPYKPSILLLRIKALLKRAGKSEEKRFYHDIDVNVARGELCKNGEKIILTKNEMLIFNHLFERQGQIVSRDELMTLLWDNDEFVNDNALSVNVSRLRNKLCDLGLSESIETRKKQGYILL